jgi:hypothetical protein
MSLSAGKTSRLLSLRLVFRISFVGMFFNVMQQHDLVNQTFFALVRLVYEISSSKEKKERKMHAGRGSNLAAPIRDPVCNTRNHSAQTNLERTAELDMSYYTTPNVSLAWATRCNDWCITNLGKRWCWLKGIRLLSLRQTWCRKGEVYESRQSCFC